MIKFICDKCGKEANAFNANNMFTITIEAPEVRKWTDDAETRSFILCYDCVILFNNWINNTILESFDPLRRL